VSDAYALLSPGYLIRDLVPDYSWESESFDHFIAIRFCENCVGIKLDPRAVHDCPLNLIRMISKKTAAKLGSGIVESAASKPAIGKLMLERLGWQEGQGLGVEGKGMKNSVQVAKRDDNKGLGAKKAGAEEEKRPEWLNDIFKAASANIPDKVGERKRTRSELSTSSSSSSSDEDDMNGLDVSQLSATDRELFLLCGKRRLGRRANRAQKGKWKREALADTTVLEKNLRLKEKVNHAIRVEKDRSAKTKA
jgi:hypothetical protein